MDPQSVEGGYSDQLEDRLRSMILDNGRSNPLDTTSSPAITVRLPPNHEQHQQQQQQQQQSPVHNRQQRNHRGYGRYSPRGRGNSQTAQTDQSAKSPQQISNQRGSQHHRRPFPRENYASSARGGGQPRYNQARAPQQQFAEQFRAQCDFLEKIALQEMPSLQISPEELESKDRFREHLERALQDLVLLSYPNDPPAVKLACFGSLASGFGMPRSDMDLALVSKAASSDIFRLFEKRLLEMGHGAHLLSKTRVPILKVCESPTPELLSALCEERQKWDDMTPEEREKFEHPARPDNDPNEEMQSAHQEPKRDDSSPPRKDTENDTLNTNAESTTTTNGTNPHQANNSAVGDQQSLAKTEVNEKEAGAIANDATIDKNPDKTANARPPRPKKQWFREKKLGPLDFPKDGVGIQCDINFANPLGLHNTLLLRCYSHCDSRVRLMILFVKAWASRRKINSARYGTLSSYGYVLMVLHFLVNVVKPPVCPNLQLARKVQSQLQPNDPNSMCNDWDVRFWRNEAEIRNIASKGMMSHNRETLGELLRNFFQYYAQQGYLPNGTPGFSWTQNVISLRTEGGILSKQAKGWTGAKVTIQDNVEVRHRYLFAIEDPFELDHNVARPVTHNGIVAIRDEFRRAWRIIVQVGRGQTPEGSLLETIQESHDDEQDGQAVEQLESQPQSPPQSASVIQTMIESKPQDDLLSHSHGAQVMSQHFPAQNELHASSGAT